MCRRRGRPPPPIPTRDPWGISTPEVYVGDYGSQQCVVVEDPPSPAPTHRPPLARSHGGEEVDHVIARPLP